MQLLRANTAIDVLIGPFLDSTDGNTVETGLTILQADVRLSKNGQNIAQKNDANAAAHDELGYHNCPLDTTDTNTEGLLDLLVHEAGALAVRHQYMVMSEAAYDSMFAAKDAGFMDVNIKTIGRADTTETEATNLEAACAAYSVTRGLTGTAVPDAVCDAAGGLVMSDAGGFDADELYDAIVTDAAGTNIAIDIIAVKAETASILADTDDIGVAGVGLTAVPWNAAWDAEVESEVTDSLIAHNLDHFMKTAVADRDIMAEVVDGTVLANLMTKTDGDTSDFDPDTDSLEAIRDKLTDIETDTNELQGDWANAGRLDAILDIIAADTTTDIPALIGTAQADLDIITGASGVIIQDGTIVAASLGADCITAAKVAADVHTENATAVWAKENATLTKAYGLIMAQVYQFLHNDMNITDATGAVALRNLANDGDMATWGITDNDTTTARTDVVWV